MTRICKVVLVVALLLVLPACNDTHSARCNTVILSADLFMEAHGYRLECAPPMPGTKPDGTWALAWTDFNSHIVYIWPDQLPDDRQLIKTAQHELGHVLYGHDETTAELFSWCTLPQSGVGYALQPFPPALSSCDQFDGWAH